MATDPDTRAPFIEFAQKNGDYYADVFLRIQKATLPRLHLNKAALLGSWIWAALRGNWLLFAIGFVIDLVAAVNLALVYKFSRAAAENADSASKAYLVERFESWTQTHLITTVLVFVLGRLLFAWLADRFYARQYEKWRIDNKTNFGFVGSRLIMAALIFALVAPLTLYRSTQFAPDERACVKQSRALQKGEQVSFKERFDCLAISEFPALVWLDRPDTVSYPRGDDGERTVKREPARDGAPPVNLRTFVQQKIDDAVGYATAFYSFLFDGITDVLRSMLNVITAVFVGTPWPIVMGVLLFVSYHLAGARTAIFVGASLAYIALFGLWQTAMATLSLVIAASLVCVVVGLPLGIWVGKSNFGKRLVTPILDIMQTIPSFVYLIPAIAFFGVGKPPAILATVIFAMPPMVRLTALGIQQVPESTKEAALAFGANPRQLLRKVELPLALPSIMAGVNQVVMMSLSMVVIAAFIGGGGLGSIVVQALNNTEVGKGVVAGLAIALLAMMIDRVVQKANTINN
ncbi:MAG: proline/glycine betaine ABC transporter permease [Pseudomonadota bacterium]